MTPTETQCAMILDAAKASAYGLVIGTSNAAKARASLYRVRNMLGDTELRELQIRVSPDDSEHELWIIRRLEAPRFDLAQAQE